MINTEQLSKQYTVKRLNEADADEILELYRGNPQFYRYCEECPTKTQALNDLRIAPPGIGPEDKYYLGFYEGEALVAIMDLIDGYPEETIAYIGLFMMNRAYQGRQIGSGIISDTAACLKSTGKNAIRLAVNRGNPQATHFWKKNGFCVIKETERNGWPLLVAEKTLTTEGKMASDKAYLDFILEQLSLPDDIAYKAMMGEYILYYRGRIIGGIYDDRFLIKPTKAARALLPDAPFALPYAGAKEMLLVDNVDDREFLATLVRRVAAELPAPKKRTEESAKPRKE